MSKLHFQSNPLRTKEDLERMVQQLIEPLVSFFTPEKSGIQLGATSAAFQGKTTWMEAFARPLWGLLPLLKGGGGTEWTDWFIEGIRHGTDPNHEGYWGNIADQDQRMVEMTVIGLALALKPDLFWEPLSLREKNNLYKWLDQINQKTPSYGNWMFFRIIVNMGFQKISMPYNKEKQIQALAVIEECYLGDGWYCDGGETQKDYYISFAFHFYGLVYAEIMKKEDPTRADLFRKRARRFAEDFLYWFAEDGSAIPFGRSLTYRFAQAAFWSACVFAEEEVLPYGELKGLILRHLRWWMKQSIFTSDGVLTIGYGYPNLIMAENYNAPGSPYWALKTFLILALSEEHPFWEAREKRLPVRQMIYKIEKAQMIIAQGQHGHTYMLTSGQYVQNAEMSHLSAKYAKFAYSNLFAFSVPKGDRGLEQGAFDSMLVFSEKDNYYRGRRNCEKWHWQGDTLYSLWKPWFDVEVETWLIPLGSWHVRLHRVETNRELDTAEGGFSIPKEAPPPTVISAADIAEMTQEENQILIRTSHHHSGIVDLFKNRKTGMISGDPNTNILYSSVTAIPMLFGELKEGKHWYGAAVLANPEGSIWLWEDPPFVKEENEYFHIYNKDRLHHSVKK